MSDYPSRGYDGQDEYTSALDITEENLFEEWLKNLFKFNTTSDIKANLNSTVIQELRKLFTKILENSSDLSKYPDLLRDKYMKNAVILVFYTLIIIISLFGNLLVCKVILSKRCFRFRTTNVLIINLTISDLLMTIFTIPVSIARLILDDWPFGSSLCILAPFIQVTSVYVSTLSMAIIALDRYQVLVYPLKARLSHKLPKPVIIGLIWTISGILSVPHAIFNRSIPLFAFRTLYRCRTVYPEPRIFYRKLLTLITFLTQYLLPLTVTLLTYGLISLKIYRKAMVGETTVAQESHRLNAKRKTIKALITVVVVFAICWLPINLYHLINDFSYFLAEAPLDMNTYLVCHWLAFSSVCWNPFIYFGLNQTYREGLRKIFFRRRSHNQNQNSLAMNTRSTVLLSRNNSKTSERKLNFMSTFVKNDKNFIANTNTSLFGCSRSAKHSVLQHNNCLNMSKCFIDVCGAGTQREGCSDATANNRTDNNAGAKCKAIECFPLTQRHD